MKTSFRLFLCLSSFLCCLGFASAAEPVEFSVGAFSFERPEGWGWVVPTSSMRKAQLSAPGDAGVTAADVTFFHFGAGQGGSVQDNVNRWVAQFQDGTSDTKAEMVGKTNITFVKAAGTFSSGMPGGAMTPMAGYALRGAILESPEGDVYVKMTGPEDVVKSNESVFERMVRQAASR